MDFSENPIAEKSDYRAKLFEFFPTLEVHSICFKLFSHLMARIRMARRSPLKEASMTTVKRVKLRSSMRRRLLDSRHPDMDSSRMMKRASTMMRRLNSMMKILKTRMMMTMEMRTTKNLRNLPTRERNECAGIYIS